MTYLMNVALFDHKLLSFQIISKTFECITTMLLKYNDWPVGFSN